MKPKILSTEILANTKLFMIEGLSLLFNNGEERRYERLKASPGRENAVMIIPMIDAETVLLVREYAVGIEDYHLGFPKGIVEPGEEILVAANRELMEEVGYGAKKLTPLKKTTTSPGYMGRQMTLVLAQDLYEQRLPGDEPEPLEIVSWPLKQLNQLLMRDDFHEARSVAALYLLREHLHGS